MKNLKSKRGFTLAEVLVTLGIIGVVAALTTPALIQNVGNAKIGPRLQKVKATIETATEMLLTEENSNSILGVTKNAEEFGKKLSDYMKITPVSSYDTAYKQYDGTEVSASDFKSLYGERFDSDEGMVYYIQLHEKQTPNERSYSNTPNNQLVGTVMVDINGAQTPNVYGKDTFLFELYNDGTVRPYASRGSKRHVNLSSAKGDWGQLTGDGVCNENKVTTGLGCAGSIFDNGMKIIYQ